MPGKRIEVELRGPLNDVTYNKLITFLESKGTFLKKENRFLIDYSTFIEGIGERKHDVRLRVTNGRVEIIVKEGTFGGTSREEASIFIEGDDLEGALAVMAMLGYRRGVACDRGITRYKIGATEVAVQDVRVYGTPGTVHSRFYEAEIVCDEGERLAAEKAIKELVMGIRLPVFEENEWNAYIQRINEEANGVFDYDQDDIELIRKLGQAERN